MSLVLLARVAPHIKPIRRYKVDFSKKPKIFARLNITRLRHLMAVGVAF